MSANSRNLPTSNPTLQGRQTSQVLVGSHGVRSAISNTSTHPLLNPQRIANDYMSNIPQGNHVDTLTGQLAPQATTRLSPIDIHNFGKAQPMVESQIDQRMREQMRQAQEGNVPTVQTSPFLRRNHVQPTNTGRPFNVPAPMPPATPPPQPTGNRTLGQVPMARSVPINMRRR